MDSAIKKFLKIIVVIFLLLISAKTFAATTTPTTYTNLGFLQNGIWYSKDPFFDGDTVRIYTAVFNSSEYDLVGKVEFYDNTKPLGQTDFSVTNGGKIRDVWVDFTATKGAHKFSAKIIDAQISKVGIAGETIRLINVQTGTDTRTIDVDTDKDGIGNTKDLDDDGDGVLDTAEIKAGTNPLVKEVTQETPKENATASDTIDLFQNPPEGTASKAAEIAQKMFDFAFNTTKTAVGKLNDFTETSYQSIEVKKAELQKEIEQEKTEKAGEKATTTGQQMDVLPEAAKPETGFSLDSPVKTAYLFLLSVLGFLLSNKTLFYIFSIFVIYKILSFIIGKFSQKIADPKQR